jgi:hypothetical protein
MWSQEIGSCCTIGIDFKMSFATWICLVLHNLLDCRSSVINPHLLSLSKLENFQSRLSRVCWLPNEEIVCPTFLKAIAVNITPKMRRGRYKTRLGKESFGHYSTTTTELSIITPTKNERNFLYFFICLWHF